MWRPKALSRVIDNAVERFGQPQEISLEANPEDLDEQTLSGLQSAGISRLSLGVQSFDDEVLLRLGRGHTGEQAARTISAAQRRFANVSLDLICGAPASTQQSLERDLSRALSLGVGHLSVYGLTIEPRTRYARLEKQRSLGAPDEDTLADRLVFARDFLVAEGFTQYEVSNYAKPGFASLHNSLYWTAGEYLGVGCGAHSFAWKEAAPARGVRSIAVSGASEYLRRAQRKESILKSQEIIQGEELLCEMVLSQVRYQEGLSLPWFKKAFGVDLVARGGEKLSRLVREKKVALDKERLKATPSGIFFVDDITLALLG